MIWQLCCAHAIVLLVLLLVYTSASLVYEICITKWIRPVERPATRHGFGRPEHGTLQPRLFFLYFPIKSLYYTMCVMIVRYMLQTSLVHNFTLFYYLNPQTVKTHALVRACSVFMRTCSERLHACGVLQRLAICMCTCMRGGAWEKGMDARWFTNLNIVEMIRAPILAMKKVNPKWYHGMVSILMH
jgi:hypothetical protein